MSRNHQLLIILMGGLSTGHISTGLTYWASNQSKRPNLKKWPDCDGGDWSLGHTNPVKGPARDIAPWDQSRLLSTVIDSGAYEQKLVTGTATRLRDKMALSFIALPDFLQRNICPHEDCRDSIGRANKLFKRKADVTRHLKSTHNKVYLDCPKRKCK